MCIAFITSFCSGLFPVGELSVQMLKIGLLNASVIANPAALLFLATHTEHSQKRFLRNFHAPHPLHAPLAFFLLFEQLALA